MGPQTAAADELHRVKYREEGESFREAMNRIAASLKDDDRHFRAFRDILMDQRFMPGGRVQLAMGGSKKTTPYNCFVSGTLEDSLSAGAGSITGRLAEATETMRRGGGIGYDFSTLRPKGTLIKKLGSASSGPVPFMEVFDAMGRAIASSGHRRGAQMGVLRIDHPDAPEFIRAKQNETRLTGFNISLAVTDEFMECLKSGKPFKLRWDGQVYREVDASALWESLMRSTWDWAEPGVLFIDTINRLNNLWYCETIAATNPCAEQPLPPHGACLLGSFNLAKYLIPHTSTLKGQYLWSFDWTQFELDIAPVVRAMDNIVDRAAYPLHEQEEEAKRKRRMGLGITGLANAGEATAGSYGSPEFLEFERRVLRTLHIEAYRASMELAREKGPFKLFDAEKYCGGEYLNKSLPAELVNDIRQSGIRNSHLTSIAPTGTISMCADNVSSGIEPVFAHESKRLINFPDGQREVVIQDYGVMALGTRGRVSKDVTIREHLDVLAEAYAWVDSAVSKTCNVPGNMAWDDFKGVYLEAYERGCKGCTTFNAEGKRMGMMVTKSEENEGAACYVDAATGIKTCDA